MNCIYDDKFYINVQECILKYTVVMYHIITTEFEMWIYTTLYLLMILLYIYQCFKIHYFYSNVYSPSTKPYGQFQLLLYFLSVFRLIWGTYGILGNYLDYIFNVKLPNFVYCDHIFYEEMQINDCFLTYRVIGFLQEVSQFMMNMMVQLLALFWNSDESPFDIILFKARKIRDKLLWGFFLLINLIGLAMIIWLTIEQFKQKYVFDFFYYSLSWTAISYLYFLYSWIQYRKINKGNQTDYKVLGVILGLSIIMRILYLAYRILCDPIEVLYKDNLQILVQGGFIIFCEYLMLFGMIKIF